MMTAVMFVVSSYAAVSVTENLAGTVTIAVVGAAGQIGTETTQWGNTTYDYAPGISPEAQALIKNAGALVITGNINSADIKALVEKNRNGNNWTLNTLDMGGATIGSIKVKTKAPWSITSHDFLPQSHMKIDCMSLTLPVAGDGILPDYFGCCLTERLTSVTLPAGYTSLGNSAFSTKTNLAKVNLPKSLESIGDNAFMQTVIKDITLPNSLLTIGREAFRQTQLTAVSFPKNLQSIGDEAFVLTYLQDVYFLGLEAPTVGPNAFDPGTYRGNDGFCLTNYSDPYPIGDTNNGKAERRNYINGANTFGVLHLRADLTNEQRAKYTDITRNYEVRKDESNAYRAYYDLYYGKMKIWPGRYSYIHTFEDAENGLLWNGTDTYEADKYKGLHKFTITASDVYVDDTESWPFGKKGQQWWTICVPFSMTKAQVSATFGENTEVCKMNSVVRNTEEHKIILKFQDDVYRKATSDNDIVISAHESYMIFPTVSPDVDIQFEGYQLEEGSPIPTIVKATQEGSVKEEKSYTYRFIGNYFSRWDKDVNNGVSQPINMPKYSYFLGAKGDKHMFFYQTGDNGKWNPYTATVQVFNGHTSLSQTSAGVDDSFILTAQGAKMNSCFGYTINDETTSIEVPDTTYHSPLIHNLQGQVVGRGYEALGNLPAGIYIVNGKKYIVQ